MELEYLDTYLFLSYLLFLLHACEMLVWMDLSLRWAGLDVDGYSTSPLWSVLGILRVLDGTVLVYMECKMD
jgi:hypothetical protein